MRYGFKTKVIGLVLIVIVQNGMAQSGETVKVRSYVTAQQGAIVQEFMSFLAIPNVASDTANIRRNARFIMDMMKKRGIAGVQLLPGKSAGVPPAVYGEVKVPKAKQTLIFYAHYDGQPVNPAQWAAGLSPFTPKLFSGTIDQGKALEVPASGVLCQPEWRIYGRGASDDKGGITAILNAYDAIVKNRIKLNYNLKFFFEGEEEAGSPHLAEILSQHASLLQSDLWVICDGPVHQTGRKVVSFGVRGDARLDLTVYGPRRPLHSGHYGNWAPNPGMMLAQLLASMKDADGRVTIKGFYDDVTPLSALEQKAIQDIPDIDDQMREELGLGWTENKGKRLNEAIAMPSLNVNGMQSGNVGKIASNQIPTTATAVLDLRLVLGNDWQRQQQKVVDHIQAQGYSVIDHDPTDEERARYTRLIKVLRGADGYNAQRTPMDMPIARKVVDAVKGTTAEAVVLLPTSGGSLPLFVFKKYLDARTITVPIANHDNNQHAENENIRLNNLFTGIETIAGVMGMKE